MYATLTDLICVFGNHKLIELTTEDPNAIAPDADRIDCAIERATSEIDSYLGECYSVPIDPVPALIKYKTIDLARFYLESGCECSEKVKETYERTMDWLKDACCGECPPEIPGLVKKVGNGKVAYYTDCRVFTRCNLEGYVRPRNYRY